MLLSKNDSFFRFMDETFNVLHSPHNHMNENEDNYSLKLLVPGLCREDFNIEVEDNVLTVTHEKKEDREDVFIRSFTKSYTLPDDIILKKIVATVVNGVLTLTIPKDKKKTNYRSIPIT